MNREAGGVGEAGATGVTDVAVVGAGAAGLMAAVSAAERGARVVLFNPRPRIGQKILISGGTRCNLTHDHVAPESYHGGSRHAVRMVLDAFPAAAARAWFEAIGVPLKVEAGGKIFPVSDSARTVVEALRAQLVARGVELVAEKVTGIAPSFRIITATGEHAARAVILATGGLSFPATGSDGSGYELARCLGHQVSELTPALTPITLDGDLHRRLQGVTVPAALTLRIAGRRAVTTAGSLLFTHFGLSGPAALDMSRHWLRAAAEGSATAGPGRELTLHLLPGDPAAAEKPGGLADAAALERAWLAAAAPAAHPRSNVLSLLGERLPARVIREVALASGLDPAAYAAPVAQLRREDRRRFAEAFTRLPLCVTGTLGYAKAEVTAGGVPLDEVDPRRMASRKCAGLYLAGEILDVEGRLGGYNFQWAWSSGRVAGQSAAAWARSMRV